jgi:Zn-dependent membrane protease YugP
MTRSTNGWCFRETIFMGLVLKQTGLIQTIEEETAVAKVLRAAAWTYVAAFITSLVYFLLHVIPLLGGRRE